MLGRPLLSSLRTQSGVPVFARKLHSRAHRTRAQYTRISKTMAASSADNVDIDAISKQLDAVDISSARNSQKGRGRGRGGRGGKGAGGGGDKREVAVSKALSKLLRHAAEDVGLKLDGEGFARVDQVMDWQRLKTLHVTFTDIRTAVSDNAKQRFSMKPNPALIQPPDVSSEEPSDWMIRANQGHSIAVDSAALLKPITIEAGNVPDVVVHGTYFAFYQSIVDSGGLKKMTRNHIHCSTGLPEDRQGVISGMRNDAEILIFVDIKKSLEDGGIRWWLSENGVVLTEGDENGVLESKYFKKVAGRKQDIGVLWEDGHEIMELPQSLKTKKGPNGKGRSGKSDPNKSRARGIVQEKQKPSKPADSIAEVKDT